MHEDFETVKVSATPNLSRRAYIPYIVPFDQTNRIRLAAVYSLLGREEDASAQAAEILRLNPKFSIKSIARWPIKNKEDLDLMMNALRKAGLPE